VIGVEAGSVRRGAGQGADQRLAVLERAVPLLNDLVGSASGLDAVQCALDFVWEVTGGPAAAWYSGDDPDRLWFGASRGLHYSRVASLRCALPTLVRWTASSEAEHVRVLSSFRVEAGIEAAVPIDAGDAVLLAQDGPASHALSPLGGLLRSALGLLQERDAARLRSERLDAGIAVAAHEFRRPLVGAKAAIECLLQDDLDRARSLTLLRRSHGELAELMRTLDSLARWSVTGTTPLDRRPSDLPALVREAVAACEPEPEAVPLVASDPESISVSADPGFLVPALANVIRRAIHHSPSDEKVLIRITESGGHATITVRDHGPAVPAAEQISLFDPFAGAEAGPRRASGLELFVAKRVVDAHDGRIWAAGDELGTFFHIVLPVDRPSESAGFPGRPGLPVAG
jgi:signal transduction histidine kinase